MKCVNVILRLAARVMAMERDVRRVKDDDSLG